MELPLKYVPSLQSPVAPAGGCGDVEAEFADGAEVVLVDVFAVVGGVDGFGVVAEVDGFGVAAEVDGFGVVAEVDVLAGPYQVLRPLWPEQAPDLAFPVKYVPSLQSPVAPAGAPAGACDMQK